MLSTIDKNEIIREERNENKISGRKRYETDNNAMTLKIQSILLITLALLNEFYTNFKNWKEIVYPKYIPFLPTGGFQNSGS